MNGPCETYPGVLGGVKSIRDFANKAIRIQKGGHIHFDNAYPIWFISLLQDADYIEQEYNREIAVLKERLRIAKEAFEKIDKITKEENTAIIAGNAYNRLTCDDHAYKYLFYEEDKKNG